MSRTPDDGSGPLDVDAAFAEIVARWGEDAPTSGSGRDLARDDDTERDTDQDAGHDAGDTGHDGQRDGTDEDRSPRHLLDPDGPGAPDDEDERAQDGPEPQAEDRARLIRPATPLPPAPVEEVPSPQWFATPRQREEEPPELRALGEERFVPADPAPLPRDVLGWAAWIAVVGAPLFLLVVALGWQDVPQLLTAITAGVFVAGFATLVIRLPSSRDDDDDDGAVV